MPIDPGALEVLRQVDPTFRAIPTTHGHRYVSSYEAARGLRVEFLTPNIGPDSDRPRTLPALRTDAQPLRFLDFLIHDPVPAVLLYDAGIHVMVPAPERYALHKLIVAQRRQDISPKRHKDIEQAEALLDVLASRRPYDVRAAWGEAWGRGKKWRQLLGQGLALVDVQVRDQLLKRVEAPRSIIPGLDLHFAAPAARYDLDRDVVTFLGQAGGADIRCATSREALEDHFGADGLDKDGRLRRFREHRREIEALVRAKYLERAVEEVSSVLIRTDEVSDLQGVTRKRKSRARTREQQP